MTRHIYITGADGVGKTTQVDRLEARLRQSTTVNRVWLRFPVVTSLPLLLYARLFGYTRYRVVEGVRVGAWEFHRSRLLRSVFPWAQYFDTLVHAGLKVYLPLLRGQRLLFERYALDVLVDLMVAIGDYNLHRRPVGRLLLRLVPKQTHVVILDAPEEVIRDRRADVRHDPVLDARLQAYRALARDLFLLRIISLESIELVAAQIEMAVGE